MLFCKATPSSRWKSSAPNARLIRTSDGLPSRRAERFASLLSRGLGSRALSSRLAHSSRAAKRQTDCSLSPLQMGQFRWPPHVLAARFGTTATFDRVNQFNEGAVSAYLTILDLEIRRAWTRNTPVQDAEPCDPEGLEGMVRCTTREGEC